MQGIKEGWLLKQGGGEGGRKSWKKRWFILGDDKLSYFKAEHDIHPLKVIALEDFISIRSKKEKNKGFRFNLETQKRKWVFCADNEEEMSSWIISIDALGTLLVKTSQEKRVVSSSNFEVKLLIATNQLLLHVSKLIQACRAMISATKSFVFRSEFSGTVKTIGPTTINLLRVVNQVYKSPYDPVAMKNFFSRLKDIKDMLENVIQVSVRYNKGTGGENANNKKAFIVALRATNEGLASLLELSFPDAVNELLVTITHFKTSVDSFVQRAMTATPKEQIEVLVKSLKSDMRNLIGVINKTEPAATQHSDHSYFKEHALQVHRKLATLIATSQQSSSAEVLSIGVDIVKDLNHLKELAGKVYNSSVPHQMKGLEIPHDLDGSTDKTPLKMSENIEMPTEQAVPADQPTSEPTDQSTKLTEPTQPPPPQLQQQPTAPDDSAQTVASPPPESSSPQNQPPTDSVREPAEPIPKENSADDKPTEQLTTQPKDNPIDPPIAPVVVVAPQSPNEASPADEPTEHQTEKPAEKPATDSHEHRSDKTINSETSEKSETTHPTPNNKVTELETGFSAPKAEHSPTLQLPEEKKEPAPSGWKRVGLSKFQKENM